MVRCGTTGLTTGKAPTQAAQRCWQLGSGARGLRWGWWPGTPRATVMCLLVSGSPQSGAGAELLSLGKRWSWEAGGLPAGSRKARPRLGLSLRVGGDTVWPGRLPCLSATY